MADALYELLRPHLKNPRSTPSENDSKYLSRLVSLRLADLTTTEPQSTAQASQSNLVSIQALSSRSHRTTTTSSDHLSTLSQSLPQLVSSVDDIRASIPNLDKSAVTFATSYSKLREDNELLAARKQAALLARQADKVQDILDLPNLLAATIASAGTSGAGGAVAGGANYSQALDLFAHIKRLQSLYPDSQLVKSVLVDAQVAMKDMTTNLISSLRSQNIRLAAAIRTIGWLRRVTPELSTNTSYSSQTRPTQLSLSTSTQALNPTQDEGHFGALFLCARLATFLSMTEALAPLRELADQETATRLSQANEASPDQTPSSSSNNASSRSHPTRRSSNTTSTYNPSAGQQTERYLKRYIEIFREQSFATISMYRNTFPEPEQESTTNSDNANLDSSSSSSLHNLLALPPAVSSFPLHLVSLLTETLQTYLPNITDVTARESLLMQVLYAANSLGRLGADFSLITALVTTTAAAEDVTTGTAMERQEKDGSTSISEPTTSAVDESGAEKTMARADEQDENKDTAADAEAGAEAASEPESIPPPTKPAVEPEWVAIIKKHRVQAARLEALAAGQDRSVHRRESNDVAVR
ncbi:hypothetical protein PV10_02832 [Exophiala mesophila]|uniref:Conserved oligomeric Golgi complex subunit 8 n=1 Tax=Exophiala mesophila TaxID=212818 RepID=A0A0D1X075_EXOME|nr:uncharacterized protein PV10_02832 [Exophiala mesophila]KIV95150.1 hypothetical protein PV10_02832 [Exophiala mesophila]